MSENITETKTAKNVEHPTTLKALVERRHKVENVIAIILLSMAIGVFVYWSLL